MSKPKPSREYETLNDALEELRAKIVTDLPGPLIPRAILALEMQGLMYRYLADGLEHGRDKQDVADDIVSGLASTLASFALALTAARQPHNVAVTDLTLDVALRKLEQTAKKIVANEPVDGAETLWVRRGEGWLS